MSRTKIDASLFSPITTAVPIKGTTTNDSAAAGDIGEAVSSTVGLTNFPASTTYGDLTSISLTAGDWDVTALSYGDIGTANWSVHIIGISSTPGNNNTGLVIGSNSMIDSFPAGTTRLISPLTISNFRVSLSATTTYYLKFRATFSSGQPQAAGRLSARRVR